MILLKNLKKDPATKKLKSMYQSFIVNETSIKDLINQDILKNE